MEPLVVVTESSALPRPIGDDKTTIKSYITGLPWQVDENAIIQGATQLIITKFQDPTNLTYGGPIGLVGQACDDQSSSRNCSRTCAQPEAMFASWDTHWNCLTLATVKLAIEQMLPPDQDSAVKRVNNAISPLGVDNIMDFDAYSVYNQTFKCAAASCRDSSIGGCSITDPGTDWDFPEVSLSLLRICEGTQSVFNGDITGPGILVSYTIQNAIAIFALVLITLCIIRRPIDWILGFTRSAFNNQTAKTPNTLVSNSPRLSRLLEALEVSDQAQAVGQLLVEFQEANAFFLIAIQIALIYASQQPATYFGLINYRSLYDNIAQLQIINAYSMAPLLLTQINIQRARLDSVYTLLLTTLAFVLGYVTEITVNMPSGDEVWRMFQGNNPIEECGQHPSLRTFCMTDNPDPPMPNDRGQAKVVAPFFSVLVLLLLRKCWTLTRETKSFHAWSAQLSPALQQTLRNVRKVCSFINSLLTLVAQIFLLVVTARNVAFFSAQINRSTDSVSAHNPEYTFPEGPKQSSPQWNIGQIIAMLLWAPVLSKYLYTSTLGVRASFSTRITKPFTVTKDSSKDNGNQDISLADYRRVGTP